jgi:predicted small lipoprotein YifL
LVGCFSPRALGAVATVAAMIVALGLAGCGRKGGLDPPPGASVVDPNAASQPAPPMSPDGRPPLPPAREPDRTSPLDFLID